MGQILLEDKIGALSHSSGVITLAASRLTIGGQQYVTSSLNRTISTDVTMAANSLYMVYAVQSGGVVDLRVSANVNSSGPSGFTSWKLVGAFYSNGSSALGSFVNIEGVPKTDYILGGSNTIGSQSTFPTKGNGGAPPLDIMRWRRNGKIIETYHQYAHTVAGTAGGAGNYLLGLPFPISTIYSLNTDSYTGAGGIYAAFSEIGKGYIQVGGTSDCISILQPYSYSPAQVRVWCFQTQPSAVGGGWGQNYYAFSNASMYWSFTASYEAQGLTETPLKDL